MNPPPLPPPLYTPSPDGPPPANRKIGWRWFLWAVFSVGLPLVALFMQGLEGALALGAFSAFCGIVASFVLAAGLAPPSQNAGRFIGLGILFAMGSCGLVLASIFAGCLIVANV